MKFLPVTRTTEGAATATLSDTASPKTVTDAPIESGPGHDTREAARPRSAWGRCLTAGIRRVRDSDVGGEGA